MKDTDIIVNVDEYSNIDKIGTCLRFELSMKASTDFAPATT